MKIDLLTPEQLAEGLGLHADAVMDSSRHGVKAAEFAYTNAPAVWETLKAHADVCVILAKIVRAHRSGNNGMFNGEAVLCGAFDGEAHRALDKAGALNLLAGYDDASLARRVREPRV